MAEMPKMNLSPEATPWGREMQNLVTQQRAEIAILNQSLSNLQRTVSGLIRAVGDIDIDPSTIAIDMSQVTTGDLPQSRVTGTWDKSVDTTGSVTADGFGTFDAGVQALGTYNQSVAGMGGFRTISVALNNGMYGGVTSSRRYKEDITEPDIPLETLRALAPKFYRYIAQTDSPEPLQLSLIAEDVDALGLNWLVDYDDEGRPDSLNERAVPYLAILLAKAALDKLDELQTPVE